MDEQIDTFATTSLFLLAVLYTAGCGAAGDTMYDGAAGGSTGGAGHDGGGHGGSGAGGRSADGGGGAGTAGTGTAGQGGTHASVGCGIPATGTSTYVRQTITIGSTEREYFLWVPRTYSLTRAYPLVFRWHGSGGNGTSGGLEIEYASGEDAIIASPSGIGGNWDLRPAGVDVALFDALLGALGNRYCIDTDRVFSYGFSAGAGLTNLLGCLRGGVVRAIAPVEGWAPQTTDCAGAVAAWITHSPDDQAVTIDRGEAARDLFIGLDGCASTTMPVSPSPCVRYQDCSDDPVDWCVTSGPHDPQGAFTGPGAWSFFDSLP